MVGVVDSGYVGELNPGSGLSTGFHDIGDDGVHHTERATREMLAQEIERTGHPDAAQIASQLRGSGAISPEVMNSALQVIGEGNHLDEEHEKDKKYEIAHLNTPHENGTSHGHFHEHDHDDGYHASHLSHESADSLWNSAHSQVSAHNDHDTVTAQVEADIANGSSWASGIMSDPNISNADKSLTKDIAVFDAKSDGYEEGYKNINALDDLAKQSVANGDNQSALILKRVSADLEAKVEAQSDISDAAKEQKLQGLADKEYAALSDSDKALLDKADMKFTGKVIDYQRADKVIDDKLAAGTIDEAEAAQLRDTFAGSKDKMVALENEHDTIGAAKAVAEGKQLEFLEAKLAKGEKLTEQDYKDAKAIIDSKTDLSNAQERAALPDQKTVDAGAKVAANDNSKAADLSKLDKQIEAVNNARSTSVSTEQNSGSPDKVAGVSSGVAEMDQAASKLTVADASIGDSVVPASNPDMAIPVQSEGMDITATA